MKKDIIYFPWLDKKGNWREHLHNEIHLLVARVQAEDDLSVQIEHGNNFVNRIEEMIDEIIKQKLAKKGLK